MKKIKILKKKNIKIIKNEYINCKNKLEVKSKNKNVAINLSIKKTLHSNVFN